MASSSGRASARIDSFLRAMVRDLARDGRTRLPQLRTIAASAGVAYPTAQRGVAALAREGVLRVRHGSGIEIASLAPSGSVTPGRLRVGASEVRVALAREVLAGIHERTGVVLTIKQLRERFGASAQVVRAAVSGLMREGLLRARGRGYEARSVSVRTGGPRTVALVLRGGPDGEVVYPSARSEDEFRSLEVACTHAGVRLALVTADSGSGRWGFPGGNEWVLHRAHSGGLLGYIVLTASIDDRMLTDLVPVFTRASCPVAVLDEGEDRSRMRGLLPVRSCQFAVAHTRDAGRQMGRLLLALGHRRVGWLSTVPGAHWSQVRLEGLRNVYHDAGYSQGVVELTPCDASSPQDDDRYVGALVRLVERSGAHERRSLAAIAQMLRDNHETIRVMTARNARIHRLRPGIQRALAESRQHRCTAWVAESDELAGAALGVLRDAGVKVPQEMSLTGFDNSRYASELGLTSYSFEGASYMSAMLRFVLGQDPRLAARTSVEPVTFPGFVVERSTSARVSEPT